MFLPSALSGIWTNSELEQTELLYFWWKTMLARGSHRLLLRQWFAGHRAKRDEAKHQFLLESNSHPAGMLRICVLKVCTVSPSALLENKRQLGSVCASVSVQVKTKINGEMHHSIKCGSICIAFVHCRRMAAHNYVFCLKKKKTGPGITEQISCFGKKVKSRIQHFPTLWPS